MGAYNDLLSVPVTCPACGLEQDAQVQFKYGDTFQFTYKVGDAIRWGGNQIGSPHEGTVRVDGATECRRCGAEIDVVIKVIAGTIAGAQQTGPENPPVRSEKGYELQ